MKKILVFIVSIIMVFALFGCDYTFDNINVTPSPSPVIKISDAFNAIQQAGESMFEGDSAAYDIGLDFQLNFNMGEQDFEYGVEGELKFNVDYINKSNTRVYGTILSTAQEQVYEMELPRLNESMYYVYDDTQTEEEDKSKVYTRRVDSEGNENVNMDRVPFNYIFYTNFDQLFDNFFAALASELDIPFDISDFALPSENLSKQDLLDFIDAISMPPSEKAMVCAIINQSITNEDLDINKYFDISISTAKVSLSFKYDKLYNFIDRIISAVETNMNNTDNDISEKISIIKEMLPSKFDYVIEVGLSNGKISSYSLNIDIETKVPEEDIFSDEDENINENVDAQNTDIQLIDLDIDIQLIITIDALTETITAPDFVLNYEEPDEEENGEGEGI